MIRFPSSGERSRKDTSPLRHPGPGEPPLVPFKSLTRSETRQRQQRVLPNPDSIQRYESWRDSQKTTMSCCTASPARTKFSLYSFEKRMELSSDAFVWTDEAT